MTAKIIIMPKKGVLDPQGKAVGNSLKSIGYENVKDVIVGKCIEIRIDNKKSEAEIREMVHGMCKSLLVNPIVEDYTFEIID